MGSLCPPAQVPLNPCLHVEMSLQSPNLTVRQLRLNITADMLPVLHIQVCNANQQKRFKAGSKQELPKIEQLQNCTGEKPHHNHYKNKYNEFLKGDLDSVLLYFISETKNSTLMRLRCFPLPTQ